MKYTRTILSIIFFTLFFQSCKNQDKNKEEHNHRQEVQAQHQDTPEKKSLSPHTSTMAMIGDAHIHIDYSSPGVRDRIIFGGLLAYDQVWQAGAHMATWVETNKDLIIDGKELQAGKYGFFTIPSKENWTLIFNTRWNQHGKDEYNVDEDILRITVKPEISEKVTEHLTYSVQETVTNEGVISLSWEKVKVQFPFKVKE